MTIKQRLRRKLSRFIRKHDVWIGQWQWARRLAGGKWERWLIRPVMDYAWISVDDWTVGERTDFIVLRREEYPNHA